MNAALAEGPAGAGLLRRPVELRVDPALMGRLVAHFSQLDADPLRLARALVGWANEQGGDNITVALARIDEPPATEPVDPHSHRGRRGARHPHHPDAAGSGGRAGPGRLIWAGRGAASSEDERKKPRGIVPLGGLPERVPARRRDRRQRDRTDRGPGRRGGRVRRRCRRDHHHRLLGSGPAFDDGRPAAAMVALDSIDGTYFAVSGTHRPSSLPDRPVRPRHGADEPPRGAGEGHISRLVADSGTAIGRC